MALRVVDTKSRLYRTGTLRRAAKVKVLSTIISFPAAFRKALVHFNCYAESVLYYHNKGRSLMNLAGIPFHLELQVH